MLSNVKTADLVTHDIGNMVGYALAAGYPGRISKWVAIDAPLPGVGHWAEQLSNPKLWHFNFHGPDEERLVTGRCSGSQSAQSASGSAHNCSLWQGAAQVGLAQIE